MIQTEFGAVPLRRPRENKKIQLHVNAGRQNEPQDTIKSGWLKKMGKEEPEKYRISVKQAMLIASTQVEIEDLSIMRIDPATGTWRTPEFILRRRQELDRKLQDMETGRGNVARRSLVAKESLQKQVHKLKKHVLTKRSAKCGSGRIRWFTIEGGKLLVYKSDSQHAKPKKSYDLNKAKCTYEYSKMPNMPSGEAFMSGKDHRICLLCTERPQGPMYLYPDEKDQSKAAKQVKNWERACKMSKYLQSTSDKEALATVVQKVSGNVMGKGWFCLFQYAKEINDTKKTVRTFAMRLMKVEHARGWNKARLVYKQRKQTLKLRQDQQEYAAKFLASRMASINSNSAARSARDVKAHMMTTICQKFRHYRSEKIFDRVYALGNNSSSRIQQLKKGVLMDCAFQSASCDDVLQMTLSGGGDKALRSDIGMLKTKKASYTENNVALHRAQVAASDSLTMLSFSEIQEQGFWEHKAEHQALAMSDWANFINIDQISSVIIHCDRQLAQSKRNEKHHELGPEVSQGVWFSINGPRVGWNRRVHAYEDRETKAPIRETMGAADGLEVGRKLAQGVAVRTLTIAVTVKGVHMPYVKKIQVKSKDSNATGNKEHVTAAPDTYLVLNILGRQFKTKNASGASPQFSGHWTAEVPVGSDDGALAGMDNSAVVVDIMEVSEDPLKSICLWSGRIPLWKVFCPDRPGQHLMEGVRHLKGRLDSMRSKGVDDESSEMHIPLSKTLPGGKGSAVKKIQIFHCNDTIGENSSNGNVELDFTASCQNAPGGKMPISPELQGCGLVTSLYATHRGAWYNPTAGLSKFSVDNVASFVEFTLKEFTFAEKDPVDEKKTCQYYVEAMCNGTSICCKPLTRSKKIWNQILKTSDGKIDFGEKKLHVPIPPGAYCAGDVKVELTVFKVTVNEEPTMTFKELLSFNKRPRSSAQSIEKVYHAIVSLEGMGVDQQRQEDNTIVLAKLPEKPSESCPGKNVWGEAESGATLKCNVVLRDRDFIRMSLTKKGEEKRALCVGDNAMLVCEEPLTYPKNELEFRHRFFPKDFDASKAKTTGGKISADLRDPSMSHEYEKSGLKTADEKKYPFKQKYIPATAEDVIPYKFVLQPNETAHQSSGLPGVWWRIMDDLSAKVGEKDEKVTIRKQPFRVVETMSHILKPVPITVLAVYSAENHNATCDVEVSPAFIFEWEQKPDRAYTLPGSVLIGEYKDASDSHVKSAPPGSGDVGQRIRRRVVLKDVPLSRLNAVHSAGFNIYDAAYVSTDDAIATAPSMIRNDFNPRASAEESMMTGGQGMERRGGYLISAGPLAADASAAATYEWSLYLHAPTEGEMCHFLAMLRHAVRMDFYNQSVKMREFQQRYVKVGNLKYQVGNALSSQSGYLEVVLVEAKRLVPKRVQKHKDSKEILKHNARPTPNPYVIFKLLKTGEPKQWAKTHGPVKIGEVLIVVVGQGWGTTVENDEDFAINLSDKAGNVVLHWAIVLKERKVRRNDYMHKRKGLIPSAEKDKDPVMKEGHWGAEDNEGIVPADIVKGQPFEVRFERAHGFWEIHINQRHDPSYDFPSMSASGERKLRDEELGKAGEVVNIQFPQPEGVMTWIVPRQEMIYRGSKQQNAPVVTSSGSPNWSRMEELASTGGWVFKTPPVDYQSHKKLIFELTVIDQQFGIPIEIGKSRMGVFGGAEAEGGATKINLCDEKMPFHNLWLPLNTEDASGRLVPNPSGEVHIMTRWVMNQSTQIQRRLPKTARAFFKQELAPKLHSSSLREPVYQLQMRCTYNPNIAKDIAHPLTRCELVGQHAEELFNTERYLACCEGRATEAWDQYLTKLQATEDLAEYRNTLLEKGNTDASFEFDENMRRGVPPQWRLADNPSTNIWHRVTGGNVVKKRLVKKHSPADKGSASSGTDDDFVIPYLALLEHSNLYKSDAMLQLQEDMVTAASWETSQYPQVVDVHLSRLKRARNICAALVTFSYESKPQADAKHQSDVEIPGSDKKAQCNVACIEEYRAEDPTCNGIAYCESLFVLAFFMLLPQVGDDKESKQMRSGMKSMRTMESATGENMGPTNTVAINQEQKKNQSKLLTEAKEEAHIFSLMFTLIGASENRAYADYFGVPRKESYRPMIADTPGVSEDIFHLNSALCRYDRELWIHMTALGFHLSSVFHGAFMRLFAMYMPTASVYRFWDLLFSESSRKDSNRGMMGAKKIHKPARHPLIDLAYGAMKNCRNVLLKCESEREFRDAIIGFLEALYDPSTMIELTTEAERELWEALPSQIGVEAEHLRDFNSNTDYYKRFLKQFQDQNEVLAELTRDIVVDTQGGRSNNQQGQSPQMQQQAQQTSLYDTRLTVRNVELQIIPKIRLEFEREAAPLATNTNQTGVPEAGKQGGAKKNGGMFRKTPDAICELGPQVESGVLGTLKYTAWSLMGPQANHFFQRATGHSKPEGHLVVPFPAFPELLSNPSFLDPGNIAKSDWDRRVPLAVGPSWNNFLTKIYDSFKMVPEHISLNEVFTAIILCSKGTVGEKALSLFRQFSYRDIPMALNHICPVMHHTKAVVEKVEGNQERERGASYAPPNDEDVARDVALHFQIYTHTQGEDMLLGEVYIQSLHSHLWAGMGSVPPQAYTIWGTKMRLPPGVVENASRSKDDPSKVRPYIGSIEMGIKWMPTVDKTKKDADRMGQVGVRVYSIEFDANRVEAVKWKNPWIKVSTYDENLHPVNLPRWDPRNALRRGANMVTAGIAYSGAFKEHIEFPETMRRDMGVLHRRWLPGETQHGFDQVTGKWCWGEKYGDQYSIENFPMRKDFVDAPKDVKTNTISLQACRMITLSILRRSLHYITNREAMCVADSIFCRSGAVPGIIDAIIVHGHQISPEYTNPTQMKQAYAKAGKTCVDVRRQIITELGKQNNRNLGKMNLWDPAFTSVEKIKLSDIEISDPFLLQPKTLWIRFCRAGDGERGQVKITIDDMGHFHPEPIYLDKSMPVGGAGTAAQMQDKAQMTLSKEEFVNCILSNPMLSESLRQLSSSDCSVAKCPKWKPIRLDVAITDPTAVQEDDDLFDVMNVRQSVLLEIWDKDYSSKDDFLGECWLPPLGSIGHDKRTFVLTVSEASKGVGGTRPDSKKQFDGSKDCVGDLTVQASWVLPGEDPGPEPENDNLESRVKREEKLHTGKLYLKIIKAEGLRVADMRRRHGSDPYVVAYVRNDCYDAKSGEDWRRNRITKLLEPIFETSVKKATINPEWNEEKTIELMTGSFEKRTKQRFAIHMTKRGKQEQTDAYARDVMADSNELRLYFGDPRHGTKDSVDGCRHDVQIYLGDTVREFKNKVMVACQKEAAACRAAGNKEGENKYRLVVMTFKHAVTVFQPSDKLRQLAAQKRDASHEYKRLYKNEENDPSCWEPLDPLRTFNHFAFFGFGQDRAQRLRISEGTEDYKLRNHRYRKYELDRQNSAKKPEDTNTEQSCFAYGQYKHAEDGGSTEWRACLVDRPESKDITSRSYKAKFIYTPKLANTSEEAAAAHMGDQTKDELDEAEVLLAPHQPKVLGSGHFEHQEFLAQAQDLSKAGKTNQEIAKILNDKLMMKFKLSQEGQEKSEGDEKKGEEKKGAVAPPPITVNEVAHHLAILNATTSPSASGKNTPRSNSSDAPPSHSMLDSLASNFRPEPKAPSAPSQAPSQAPSNRPPGPPGQPGQPGTGPPQRTGPPGGPNPIGGPQRTGPPGIGGPRAGAGVGGPQRG